MSTSVTNIGIDGLDQVEQIGTGGSSRVYKARQVDLDRVVAVKVLSLSEDRDVSKRFDRERKAMGRLSLHEGIVPVYSTGTTSFGEPFLVMPYYANGSLQDQINTGPMEWQTAVGFVDAAAETIAAAHDAGVVHLDIKPANILLTTSGRPTIADFGIAKLSGSSGSSTTTNGAAFTPAYSGPETFLEGETGPASDVYGLGATLWALLVGHPPFMAPGEDPSLMAVIGRVVNNQVGELNSLAPRAVADVINKAMAKNASDRYQTARQFSVALKDATAAANSPLPESAPPTALGSTLFPDVPVSSAPVTGSLPIAEPTALGSEPIAEQTVFGNEGVGPSAPPTANHQIGTIPDAPIQASPSVLSDTTAVPPVPLGVPSETRTPVIDFDRLRLGPVVLAAIAFAAIVAFAGFSLLGNGSENEADSTIAGPEGPETSLDGLDNPQGSLPSSADDEAADLDESTASSLVTSPSSPSLPSTLPTGSASPQVTTERRPAPSSAAAPTPSPTTPTSPSSAGTASSAASPSSAGTPSSADDPDDTSATTDTDVTTPTSDDDTTDSSTSDSTDPNPDPDPPTEDPDPIPAPELTATASGSDSVDLAWTAQTGVDAYQVRQGVQRIGTPVTTTSLEVPDLDPGTYTFTVTPVVDGEEILASRSDTVTVTVGPPSVTNLTAAFRGETLVVDFAFNKAAGYRVSLTAIGEGPLFRPKLGEGETGTVEFDNVDLVNTYLVSLTTKDLATDTNVPPATTLTCTPSGTTNVCG